MFVPEALRTRFWPKFSDRAQDRKYIPAHVQYVMIFSPVLTEHLGAEDPGRLIGQQLFYTSMENAVSKVQTVREIALANALIDFSTSMQHHCGQESEEQRKLAVQSAERRLYLVEVFPDMWLHASVALARWNLKNDGDKLMPWLVDAWMHQQMEDAWHGWRLQYGPPHVLFLDQGREVLEKCLESYFSKWTWQWNVDVQYAPVLRTSEPASVKSGLVGETLPTLEAIGDVSMNEIAPLLAQFAAEGSTIDTAPPMDVMLLYDDKMLWPKPHSQTAAHTDLLSPPDRRQVARYVLERLVGLTSARAKADMAFAKRTKKPNSTHPSGSQGVMNDLSFMANMLGDLPSFMSLDSMWHSSDPAASMSASGPSHDTAPAPPPESPYAPEEQILNDAKSPADDQKTAKLPRLSPRIYPVQANESVTMPASSSMPKTKGASSAFQAFHERLEQALGQHDLSTETNGITVPPSDDAARQLEEITQTFAKSSAPTRRRARLQRHESDNMRDTSRRATSWYASHQAAGTMPEVNELHDYSMDGWGPETPAPWRHASLHVNAQDAEPLTTTPTTNSSVIDIVYMTRQLLTVVLVWRQDQIQAGEHGVWQLPAWDLLRRVQRVLNDARRRADGKETPATSFLHMDATSALCINELTGPQHKHQKTFPSAAATAVPVPLSSGTEAQLLTAKDWMKCHGIRETLSRADNHSFWVASRASQDGMSSTFMTLEGDAQRRYGVSECDHQLRRLAAQHSEFGL